VKKHSTRDDEIAAEKDQTFDTLARSIYQDESFDTAALFDLAGEIFQRP
jgi:hypothetical protein